MYFSNTSDSVWRTELFKKLLKLDVGGDLHIYSGQYRLHIVAIETILAFPAVQFSAHDVSETVLDSQFLYRIKIGGHLKPNFM